MGQDDLYYQPPQDHDQHLRNFVRWMLVGMAVFVIIVVFLVTYANKLLPLIPFSVEQRFVAPYVELYRDQRSLSDADLMTEQQLQDLAVRLGSVMDLPDDMTIQLHLIDSAELNAFATLGGNIFIFRGLLESMPDENSLAMVIAHEIAHIKHRDPIVGISRGLLIQIVYGFATGDAATVAGFASEVGILFFSREQESAADLVAVDALNSYYGNVEGSTTFFTLAMKAVDENQAESPEWLSTHPDLANRISAIETYIDTRRYQEGRVTPLHLKIEG